MASEPAPASLPAVTATRAAREVDRLVEGSYARVPPEPQLTGALGAAILAGRDLAGAR